MSNYNREFLVDLGWVMLYGLIAAATYLLVVAVVAAVTHSLTATALTATVVATVALLSLACWGPYL